MIPATGPSVYVVPFSVGMALPTGRSATVEIYFPRSVFLTGMLALPVPDLISYASYEAQIAQLSLEVIDEVSQPLVSDTRGAAQATPGVLRPPAAAPFLLLFGRAYHPHPLQRPIASLDRWQFTVQNADAVHAQALLGIYLYFSEPGGQ